MFLTKKLLTLRKREEQKYAGFRCIMFRVSFERFLAVLAVVEFVNDHLIFHSVKISCHLNNVLKKKIIAKIVICN